MTKVVPYVFKNEVDTESNEFVLTLSGAIGESTWYYDAISANSIRESLKDVKDETIRILLNSGGGDAMQGIEIYNYLKSLPNKVVIEVTANASSAASIIAMGADELVMLNGSTLMIHEAATMAYGTKADIQKTMNALEAVDKSLVNIYHEKTGLSVEEISEMLQAETWFTAEEAVAKGFANSFVGPETEVNPEIAALRKELSDIKNQLSNFSKDIVAPIEVPAPIAAKRRALLI